MTNRHGTQGTAERGWWAGGDCRLDQFVRELASGTDPADYLFAERIEHHAPIYQGCAVRELGADRTTRRRIQSEWARALLEGPGLVIFEQAFDDLSVIDAASAFFRQIIAEQHGTASHAGDHFAKPGANDRIWNALQKLCLGDPRTFALYYANPLVSWVAQAWLGWGYQVTSQVNVVNPGGEAQSVHRDYHLGFQTAEEISDLPAHVHQLSPLLTLQGAVAHVDMPIDSGPTLYLPYSQRYAPGYLAWRKSEFQEYFRQHAIQLPLRRGDAVFFNPALFHAAGGNRTTHVERMANLLQISSAYGRAMESVDRTRMCDSLYSTLCELRDTQQLTREMLACAVRACAEGYAFPTNLDRDPPLGGLAPPTQQQLMLQALDERWDVVTFRQRLAQQSERRLA